MVARTLLLRTTGAVRAHVPMIKFRKGGLMSSEPKRGDSGPTAHAQAQPPRAAAGRPAIEDFQLPPKYRRTPLSDAEIAYINRGGPE